LLSKLCYLFSYPLQSFACALNEVAKKNGGAVEEVKAEVKEEEKVEEVKIEETKEETKEEAKVEETPAE
jgi:Sec-independent protein translocase protein TatA